MKNVNFRPSRSPRCLNRSGLRAASQEAVLVALSVTGRGRPQVGSAGGRPLLADLGRPHPESPVG